MKKIISLLKATMSQDMTLFRIRRKSDSTFGKLVLPIVIGLIFMLSIGSYAYFFAEELSPDGLTYIVISMFIIISSLLTAIEGAYKSQGILFEAKDSDLLFSLPISKSKIFFTRIFKMISFQSLYDTLFLLPVFVVYDIFESVPIYYYVLVLLFLVLLPILPTIIGSIVGYIIKYVSSKTKNKNAVQIVLTLCVFLTVFYLSFKSESISTNIIENAGNFQTIISKIYYPAVLCSNLVKHFNALDLLILLAISIIPLIIFVYLASIFYFKIISRLSEKGNVHKVSSNNSKKIESKVKKPLFALIYKELKRFFSSPVLIINSCFSLVLVVVITIALSTNFDGMISSFAETSEGDFSFGIEDAKMLMPKIFFCIVVFSSCMTSITSSLISLEGKSFNITKSLPINEDKILLSKIFTSNLLSIPVILLCDVIFFVRFTPSILDILLIVIASFVFPTFSAILGLQMNLKYPKMNAASDSEVVKQSMSSSLSITIGMFASIIGVAISMLGISNIFSAIVLLAFSIVTLFMWFNLKKNGVQKFRKINV